MKLVLPCKWSCSKISVNQAVKEAIGCWWKFRKALWSQNPIQSDSLVEEVKFWSLSSLSNKANCKSSAPFKTMHHRELDNKKTKQGEQWRREQKRNTIRWWKKDMQFCCAFSNDFRMFLNSFFTWLCCILSSHWSAISLNQTVAMYNMDRVLISDSRGWFQSVFCVKLWIS